MSIPTYSLAQATTLVAVSRLQSLASHAENLFLEERCTRAADNLLSSMDSTPIDSPGFSEDDVALATEQMTDGELPAIMKLRRRGRALAQKAITNVKKTVRRQFKCRSPQIPESECDSAAEMENRLECQDLLLLATPSQQRVLAMRLVGHDDEWIADQLGITTGNVAVLAYRGVSWIRGKLRGRGVLEELAA